MSSMIFQNGSLFEYIERSIEHYLMYDDMEINILVILLFVIGGTLLKNIIEELSEAEESENSL